MALACYVPLCGAGPFVSLLVLLFARRRPWLRGQASQSLALAALTVAAVVGLWLGDFALEAVGLWSPGLVAVALQLAAAALYVGLSVRSMILAYQRRDAALPWIGARARRWAGAGS